jgi:predicted  nucleic acid-binding Zn-ribbon protein
MNRSILIVICDFLLVSLLVFSTPDLTKVTGETGASATPASEATNAPSGGKDLANVMRTALTEEQQKREQLVAELEKTRQNATKQQGLLSENEKRAQTLQEEQATLKQQFAAAQTNISSLSQQLNARSTEATLSKEQLAALQADIQKQQDQSAALKKQLADLEKANQAALADRERLTNQLQIADLERRHAAEQAAQAQQQVQIERQEKASLLQQNTKLAEGVKSLATNSSALAQEIRENRPLASNTIFNDFVTNAVDVQFTATKPGFFGGESTKDRAAKTILITDGTNTFAMCHVQDTPLQFWVPATDWDGLTVTLQHGTGRLPLPSLSFSRLDPRVVMMPVTQTEASRLGAKVYHESGDPFKFQDAVLVGAQESYYGECKFQIDVKTPNYVKLDRSLIKGLFGKFNPSRGDLVFSRTGELLGIMANDTYCMVIRKFDSTATFQLGQSMRAQNLADTLSHFYVSLQGMPPELQ